MFWSQQGGVDRRPSIGPCHLENGRWQPRVYRYGPGDNAVFVCWKCLHDVVRMPPPKPLDDA